MGVTSNSPAAANRSLSEVVPADTDSNKSPGTTAAPADATLKEMRQLASQQATVAQTLETDRHPAPRVTPDALWVIMFARLQALGKPEENSAGDKTATPLLTAREARSYRSAFGYHRPLMNSFLQRAADLPTTLNPNDFNMLRKLLAESASLDSLYESGQWQHSLIPGSAGMFLHHVTHRPADTVGWLAKAKFSSLAHSHHDLLKTYRNQLQKSAYSDKETLERGLGASVATGVLHDVVFWLRDDSEHGTLNTRQRALRQALDNLLDIADLLAMQDLLDAMDLTAWYQRHGRAERARLILRSLLEDQLTERPARLALAHGFEQAGRYRDAYRHYSRILETGPDEAEHLLAHGRTALRIARYRKSILSLQKAAALDPDNTEIRALLKQSRHFAVLQRDAAQADNIPVVQRINQEDDADSWHDTLAFAAEQFRRYGVLLVENAFDPQLIDTCCSQLLEEHADANALSEGGLSLAIGGAFNQPGFYANPFILALMHQLLGKTAILGSANASIAQPDAAAELGHKKHRPLFSEHTEDQPPDLPPVAITAMIPLVSLNAANGTVAVRKGSHQVQPAATRRPLQAPNLPIGSCLLADMSLTCKRLHNASAAVQPIANLTYQRRWFVDRNATLGVSPLVISRQEYSRIPDVHTDLFNWALADRPRVNEDDEKPNTRSGGGRSRRTRKNRKR